METAKPSDWQIIPLPLKHGTIHLDRRFLPQETQRLKSGFVPRQMEDKWFVYWQGDTLFFHRSWTGFCVYVVRFTSDGDSYRMVEADVNRDAEQYSGTDDDYDRRMISYLIDILLLGIDSDFPSDEADSQVTALMQWSDVGRAMLGQHPKGKRPRT